MHRVLTAATIVVGGVVAAKVIKEVKDFIVLDLALPQMYHLRKYHEQIVKAASKMEGLTTEELMGPVRNERFVPWLPGSDVGTMQSGTSMT